MKYVCCPYYSYDAGNYIACDSLYMKFTDHDSLKAYRRIYCGSVKGWCECPLAKRLNAEAEEAEEQERAKAIEEYSKKHKQQIADRHDREEQMEKEWRNKHFTE